MKLSKTAKNMILVIIASSAIFIAIAAFILSYYQFNLISFAVGVFIGSGLNVAKVIMLESTVSRAVRLEEKDAATYLRAQALLRFILTGVVLAAAAIIPFINLWGVVAGIFTLQISAYSMKLFIHDEVKKPDEKTPAEPEDEEKIGEGIRIPVGEKNNDIEDMSTPVTEENREEDPGEAEDEEKQRIKKKPADRRAGNRMKKKPTRRYR